MRSFLARCLQPDATSLACSTSADHLVQTTRDGLRVWAWGGEGAQLLHALHSHAPLLHAAALSWEAGSHVLVVADDLTITLYSWQPGGGGPAPVAAASLRLTTPAQPPRLHQPVFSAPTSLSDQCALVAVSLYEGVVQMVSVRREEDGAAAVLVVQTSYLTRVVSAEPGSSIVPESIALQPSLLPSQERRCCAAVLYTAYGPGGLGGEKCVACLDCDEGGVLRPGPWFIRNLSPSTALVHATGACAAGAAGPSFLVASSAGVVHISATAPYDKEVLTSPGLAGVPTCIAALGSRGRFLLADSQGALHVLDVQQQRWLGSVPLSRALPAPSSLLLLSGGSWSYNAAAGLLFVGSDQGASCLVEVPREALQAPSLGAACWEVLPGEAEGLDSLAPVREGCLIPDPSGCGDGRLLLACGTGPSGQLALAGWAAGLVPLVSGGAGMPVPVRLLPLCESAGSRHHSHLLFASELDSSTTALEVGGTHFRQSAFPRLRQGEATLACSPVAGGLLLQVTTQGAYTLRPDSGEVVSSWQPAAGGAASVSMAAIHGQSAALASGAVVHCLSASGATGRLQAERELALGQQVSALALVELGPPGEGGAHEAPPAPGELFVAAGLWVSNTVVLQQLSADSPACTLSLGGRQPRSLAACRLGRECFLFVGTSTGELMWWAASATPGRFGAPAAVRLEPRQWARVGAAPVELQSVRLPGGVPPAASPPAPWRCHGAGASSSSSNSSSSQAGSQLRQPQQEPYLLAKSDQLLVVSTAPASPWEASPAGGKQQEHPRRQPLAVRRVQSGQNLAAICPLNTAELPPHSLAWVTSSGHLHIGRLELCEALRWDGVRLGATPTLPPAYHAASHCAAVACREAGGACSLRLVDVGQAREVARLPMAEGHTVTAVGIAALPCSGTGNGSIGDSNSNGASAAGGGQGAGAAGCKEFLLVASCLEGRGPAQFVPGSTDAAEPMDTAGAGAASGAEPWWRGPGGATAWQHAGAPASSEGGEAAAAAGPALWGLLSVFEIQQHAATNHSAAAAADGGEEEQQGASGGRARYQLALHGTVPLPTVCYSLASVVPDTAPYNRREPLPSAAQQQSAAPDAEGASAPAAPLLVLGCQDGLRLYRAYVDDAGVEALQEVERSLQSVAVAEPLQFDGTGCAGAAAAPAAEAGAAAARAGGRRLWHQRVALQLLHKARTFNDGVPTALQAEGGTLFCTELLSSLSAWQVRPPAAGRLPALIPCSADRSGSCAGAVLPLSATHVLVGVRPRGLALLRRSPAAERQAHMAARARFEQRLERGDEGSSSEDEDDARDELGLGEAAVAAPQQQQQQHGGVTGGRPVFWPSLKDCPDLEVVAACGLAGPAAAICPGRLGVPVHDLQAGQEPGSKLPGVSSASGSEGPGAAVVVAADGAAHALCMLGEDQLPPLLQLQQALQRLEQQQGLALPGVLPRAPDERGDGGHAAWWRWTPAAAAPAEEEGGARAGGGNCLDADFCQAALQLLPAGAAGAAGSLGLPADGVARALQLLSALDSLAPGGAQG